MRNLKTVKFLSFLLFMLVSVARGEQIFDSRAPASIENQAEIDLAFMKAVNDGDTSAVDRFLKDGLDVNLYIFWRDENIGKGGLGWSGIFRNSPLQIAVENEDKSMVKLLLKNGADVGRGYVRGDTVLHHAARKGSKKIIEILLEYGADVMKQTWRGDSVISYLFFPEYSYIVLEMIPPIVNLQSGDPDGVLFDEKRKEIALLLIKHGVSLDVRDEIGRTLLYRAFLNNNVELFTFLVEHGVDLNASSLCVPSMMCYFDIRTRYPIKLLLAPGADINVKDSSGMTPLDCEDIKQLIRQTILHCAVKNGNEDLVKFLLEHGADKNIKDRSGRMPLDCVPNGREDIEKLLRDHGAQ